MPWPRLKMKRLPRIASRIAAHPPLHRLAAGHQQQRIEIALHHDRPSRQTLAPSARAASPCRSRCHRRRSPRHSRRDATPAPRGNPMTGTSGCRAAQPPHDLARRRRPPSARTRRRAGCRPSCRRSAARRRRPRPAPTDSSTEASTSRSISRANACGIAIGPQPRRGLVRRALPADHVGRDRPRRAAEPDQGRLRSADPGGPAPRVSATSRELALARSTDRSRARSAAIAVIGSSRGPSPSTKRTGWPKRIRHDQDVGEQDRRVEAIAPDRLQRHLGGQRRACSTGRESRRPWPAPHGTPADSGPACRISQIGGGLTASPANGCRKRHAFRTCARARRLARS